MGVDPFAVGSYQWIWVTSCFALVHGAHVCALLSLSLCACEQSDGDTPLVVASLEGHADTVRVLVDAGAAVNQADVGSCLWGAVFQWVSVATCQSSGGPFFVWFWFVGQCVLAFCACFP